MIYNFQIKIPCIEEGVSGGVENLRASGSKGRNAPDPCSQEIHISQPGCLWWLRITLRIAVLLFLGGENGRPEKLKGFLH